MDPTVNFLKDINERFDNWLYIPVERIETFQASNSKLILTPKTTKSKQEVDAYFLEPEAVIYANLDAILGMSWQGMDNNTLDYRLWHAPKRFVMTFNCNGAAEYFLWRNPNWYCPSTPINPVDIWANLDDKKRVLPIVNPKGEPDITIGILSATPKFKADLLMALEHLRGDVGSLIIKVDDDQMIPIIGLLCGAFERVGVVAPYSRIQEHDRYVVLQKFRRNTLATVGKLLLGDQNVTGDYSELKAALQAPIPPRDIKQIDMLRVLAFWCIPSGGWKNYSRGR
jgi:hypothetical protein